VQWERWRSQKKNSREQDVGVAWEGIENETLMILKGGE